MFDENVGPSMYAKSQGLPVKIWGFFANGHLEYYVLPTDTNKKTAKSAKAKAKAKGKKKRLYGTVNMTTNRYVHRFIDSNTRGYAL